MVHVSGVKKLMLLVALGLPCAAIKAEINDQKKALFGIGILAGTVVGGFAVHVYGLLRPPVDDAVYVALHAAWKATFDNYTAVNAQLADESMMKHPNLKNIVNLSEQKIMLYEKLNGLNARMRESDSFKKGEILADTQEWLQLARVAVEHTKTRLQDLISEKIKEEENLKAAMAGDAHKK